MKLKVAATLVRPFPDRIRIVQYETKDGRRLYFVRRVNEPRWKKIRAVLAENGRLNKVHKFLDAYGKIMSAVKGELDCVVTTAQPLNAKQEKELMAILQSFVKPGQSISVSKTVDESLIGGMQVFIGDKFIDMSIASKIKSYEDVILRAKAEL